MEDRMMIIILVFIAFIVVVISNLISLVVGAKIGQSVIHGKEIKIPNPITSVKEAIEEFQDEREQNEEQERVKTMLENIDIYDGTGLGQKDV